MCAEVAAAVVVVGFRSGECECYEFAVALNVVQVEVVAGGYGIGNLPPGCYYGLWFLLLACSEHKKGCKEDGEVFHGCKGTKKNEDKGGN